MKGLTVISAAYKNDILANYKWLWQKVKEKYGFEVGADGEKQPPFATITLDDKNRFIGSGDS